MTHDGSGVGVAAAKMIAGGVPMVIAKTGGEDYHRATSILVTE
jgi:hypothetical protein